MKQLNERLGTQHIRTTAFHPQANGMIERLHRVLKAAMKSKDTTNWSAELPLIMLGIRSTFKEDIQSTPAELVYGRTLRLPSEFFTETKPIDNETEFIQQFRHSMNNIRPRQTSHHIIDKPFIQRGLDQCKQVFIRNDTVRIPLQQPYDGPFEIIKRYDKFYKVLVNGKQKNVTIDRLKAAFIDEDTPAPPTPDESNHNTPPVPVEE